MPKKLTAFDPAEYLLTDEERQEFMVLAQKSGDAEFIEHSQSIVDRSIELNSPKSAPAYGFGD